MSTASYFSKALTEDTFELIRRSGVEVCEVFLTTFSEYEPEFGDLLASRLKGLRVHSVHTLTNQFEPQLFNRADRTRADAFKILDKVGKVMQKLGAKYYTFHGASIIKKSQLNVNYQYESMRIKDICDKIAEYGGELTYENVHWANYRNPTFMEELHKYIPDLKTCLDIKQAMQSGYDYHEYLKVDGKSLRTVHVCDYDGDKLCPPGRGKFDFYEFMCRLRDAGYDGPIMIELYSRDYNSFDEVTESVNYLKNILDRI